MSSRNLYARYFETAGAPAISPSHAAIAAANAYLDNKPTGTSAKIGRARRDADFWSCPYWEKVPADAWHSQVMTAALARYFAQEDTHNPALLERLAATCPSVVVKAVRHSGLVVKPAPVRRAELSRLGQQYPEMAELCRVLYVFGHAYGELLETLAAAQEPFASVTPFELLLLASLHAFEHLIPRGMASPQRAEGVMSADQEVWLTLNDIFQWKLERAQPKDFALTEHAIGIVLQRHLAPVLQSLPGREDGGAALRARFAALVAAQQELNAFLSQSADAFSYDDAIRFERHGTILEIVEVNADARIAWARDNRKLARLKEYWFYRAMDDFVTSGMALKIIGQAENHEANRLAYIRALRTRLQLSEVYGIAESATTNDGRPVDVFQACLSLELTSAFFQRDFLEVFMGYLRASGDWRVALRQLATGGFAAGMQNRLPLTWSDRAAKISKIIGWTVTAESPQGDAAMAAAILDFWSADWAALSVELQTAKTGLRPALLERPILKFGEVLVQLPWHGGLQDNTTAAVNNLRRLGQRRGEARLETQRIEAGLGRALEARGFAVVHGWTPDRATHGDAGEVDLVCALEGLVFVIEVKSTFIRMSQKEAFQHAATTLRHAGRQVIRKVAAVGLELQGEGALRTALRLDAPVDAPQVVGWIVDTSIECDHQHFAGVLKVSLEEVLIALRDDASLLRDPCNVFLSDPDRSPGTEDANAERSTLYPDGFSARRFIEVIKQAEVWADL